MTKEKKIDALQKAIAFIKTGNFGLTPSGLCGVVIHLEFSGKINCEQINFLNCCIDTIPEKAYKAGVYAWKQGAKAPRIKFLNEQIENLEKECLTKKKKKKTGSKR